MKIQRKKYEVNNSILTAFIILVILISGLGKVDTAEAAS